MILVLDSNSNTCHDVVNSNQTKKEKIGWFISAL